MSDTTSISSILTQRISTGKSVDKSANLKIVEIPKSIDTSKSSQTLRGKVFSMDNDGAIYIKTNKGEIKARIEQKISIEKGDNVEIKIGKGSPPISANIVKTKSKIEVQIQPQTFSQNAFSYVYPKNISAQKLVDLNIVKVDLLTPQIAQKITTPYIDIINTNLNLVDNVPVLIDLAKVRRVPTDRLLTTDIIATDLNKMLPINIVQSFISPVESKPPQQRGKDISAYFKLDIFSTEIPLRTIIEKIIASPLELPINISASTNYTPALSIFAEINIQKIDYPILQIQHGDDEYIANAKAGEIRAELVGFTEDKSFPVLKIISPQQSRTDEAKYDQHYALQVPVEGLILGSIIELNIVKSSYITTIIPDISTTSPTHATPLTTINSGFILTPGIWTAMQEILQVLTQNNPAVTQSFNNIIPSPSSPSQLSGAALFFLAAMRSGDVQSWLGEKVVDILKRTGKSDLINRLSSEFSTLSRISSDNSGEWRVASLPLAWQNEIHKMVVNYRREESGSDNENDSSAKTRFVMDLNLSNMGKVQLDGLFTGGSHNTGRIDLILRTEQGFSSSMKREMRQKYKSALDDVNFTGELAFQDKAEQWVNMAPDAKSKFLEDV